MGSTSAFEAPQPSESDLRIYQLIAAGEPLGEQSMPAVERLLAMALIIPEPFQSSGFMVVDPDQVEARLRAAAHRQLEQLLGGIPSLVAELQARQVSGIEARAGAVSVFVEGVDAVNGAIAQAVDGAQREILSSQPGPRPRAVLQLSVDRDRNAVERGVDLRVLYSASSRANRATGERVTDLSAIGAEFRTLSGRFLRAIVVDRELAIVEDSADGRPSAEGAYVVRDRAAVGYIAESFALDWERAIEWHSVDPLVPPGQAITTPLQRTVLNGLRSGQDQQQIAKSLGYSGKTVGTALGDLRTKLGLRTVYQLMVWWMGPEGLAEQELD
ncbi:LuxR C-terminal-related transcriptional regulator [Streptomyces sp. NPDC098789]|uniref:LuxR C-terminal-related transcriptional regulator n=1 Tax=Streptomyces sp. NPDC098789 TaxID=3366098 RepID=UPI00381E1994